MMSQEITVLKIGKIFFGIISGRTQTIADGDPTRSHTVICSKYFQTSSSHTKILNDTEHFLGLLLVWKFLRDNKVSVDIAMYKMVINLKYRMRGDNKAHTLLLTVPRIPIKQCSLVRTNTAFLLSCSVVLLIGITPVDRQS